MFFALQVAFYMGFQQVILVGVDHSFGGSESPSNGDYFTHGYIAHDTTSLAARNLRQWELAYELARRAYEADGREVLDATVAGKLQVFRKVAYEAMV